MAIAFDSSSNGGSSPTAGVLTWTHTTVGANTVMVIYVINGVGGRTNTVTVDAVSATQVVTGKQGVTASDMYLFYIGGLSAGLHTIVFTDSNTVAGDFQAGGSVAYTGAAGGLDISTSSVSGIHASIFTTTLNPVATNAWTVLGSRWEGDTQVADTGTTLRQPGAPNAIYFLGDSNGAVSGSTSMTIHSQQNDSVGTVMLSISPTASGGATAQRNTNLNILGTGQ